MFAKFAIDYSTRHQHNERAVTYQTDDPMELEEFLVHLLATGSHILEIRHDGQALPQNQFDHLIKKAVDLCAAEMLRTSLEIDRLTLKSRFGLAD